jgi:hypothetical protein
MGGVQWSVETDRKQIEDERVFVYKNNKRDSRTQVIGG